MNDLNKKVASGLTWKFIERLLVQGSQFAIQVVLARILFPEDYAIVALTAVFIQVSSIIVQKGFAQTLIQKKDSDELDFSTIFYFSMFISLLLYLILWLIAPFVSSYYDIKVLETVLRVQSVVLLFGAVNSIQTASLQKRMHFYKTFIRSIVWVVVQGSSGIYLAYNGYGVWALVISNILATFSGTIVLWFTVKWRPSLKFSFSRLRDLLGFGSAILVVETSEVFFKNIYSLAIGKTESPEVLGYYNRGYNIPYIVTNLVNNPLMGVMYPAMSNIDKKTELRDMYKKSINLALYIILPFLIMLMISSEEIITILLTEKWLPSAEYLFWTSITISFIPLLSINTQLVKSTGDSKQFLTIELFKRVFQMFILVITIPFGVSAIVLGMIVSYLVMTIFSMIPVSNIISYSFFEQVKTVSVNYLLGIITFTIVMIFDVNLNIYLNVILNSLSIVIIYILLSMIFKNESFMELFRMVKSRIRK